MAALLFDVRETTGGQVLAGNTTPIDFDTVNVNVGGCFSVNTFTAPAAGGYLFCGALTKSAGDPRAGFWINNTAAGGVGQAAAADFEWNISNFALSFNLAISDEVELRTLQGGTLGSGTPDQNWWQCAQLTNAAILHFDGHYNSGGVIPTDGAWIFNVASVNLAGSYDTSTGVFTAPYDRLYLFSLAIRGNPPNTNQAEIALFIDGVYDRKICSSNGKIANGMVLAHLAEGQTASIRHIDLNSITMSGTTYQESMLKIVGL